MTTMRVQKVRAADLKRGDVIDNVSRMFVVEAAESNGRTVAITYRYTDDRGIVLQETTSAHRTDIMRIRTDADPDIVDGILAATVGLPR